MLEKNVQVTRTARYFSQVFDLAEGDTGSPVLILLALHGYAQLADEFGKPVIEAVSNVTSSRLSNKYSKIITVFPEGLSRFYSKGVTGNVAASWMTSTDRENEIADYLA